MPTGIHTDVMYVRMHICMYTHTNTITMVVVEATSATARMPLQFKTTNQS